jgi:hypothetical protein
MNEPTTGPRVRWCRAVADSELYRGIQDAQGHPGDWQVLPMSCFAVTEVWAPARLARDTGFRQY